MKIIPRSTTFIILSALCASTNIASADDIITIDVTGYRTSDASSLPNNRLPGMPGGPSIRTDAAAAAARNAAAEKRKQDCLDNASSFQSQCKTTYASANTMCNTSNALLTGGAGKGVLTFAQWKNMITDKTVSEVSALVSASSLASGYNTDFPFPCTSWNDQAIKACDTLASQKVSACPK